jgi:hypothetical protein
MGVVASTDRRRVSLDAAARTGRRMVRMAAGHSVGVGRRGRRARRPQPTMRRKIRHPRRMNRRRQRPRFSTELQTFVSARSRALRFPASARPGLFLSKVLRTISFSPRGFNYVGELASAGRRVPARRLARF